MRKLMQRLEDTVRRMVLRPVGKTVNRCRECDAKVGQDCVNPFCYGSLGDGPRGEFDASTPLTRAVTVMRTSIGRPKATSFTLEQMADVVADLMHLAEEDGHDPYALIDKATGYYVTDEGDAEFADIKAVVGR